MKGKLNPDTLYLGDNGRAFCGTLRCAGSSSFFTGRDLSGQRVEPCSAQEANEYGIKCEGCGMTPSLIVSPSLVQASS